ncbi:MAG TPA: serine/threonine protein kinase [Mariprofundaceae bacterium]|nr:serine/threonine protein kinase [Mariprofundaceae bacterium]
MSSPDQTHEFYALGPEQVLQAIESLGYHCNGYQLALNSYENRVYQVGLEEHVDGETSLVTKFYRPNRWDDAAILEEHIFTQELASIDVPAVPPLSIRGETLHCFESFRFALYPLRAGRAPDLENPLHLEQLGRFVGRIHALGAAQPFRHRPTLSVQHFGDDSYEYLLDHGFLPPELELAYEALAEELLDRVEDAFETVKPQRIRLQGDAHPGNILWKAGLQGDVGGPYILDFDDARMGPAVQDLWMFLSGDPGQMETSLDILLSAYTRFHDFDTRELALIEPLRTLRMMHYAAWLARRHDDPAFQRAFPWFNTEHYWQEHILSLKEQLSALQEPPISWVV